VPLQLDEDYQIRTHSRFANNGEFLREVIGSFAKRAPEGTLLLVKIHPLHNGLVNRRRQVRTIAREIGVGERVCCVEAGHLPTLLEAARGVVLVNSTVGTSALNHRCPLIALGDAIYNVPGLTFQGALDEFWENATTPDDELYDAFRRITVNNTQVNGSFFHPLGIDLGVRAAAERLSVAAGTRELIARSVETEEAEFADGLAVAP
jgi:capsular polysaccharide export protein